VVRLYRNLVRLDDARVLVARIFLIIKWVRRGVELALDRATVSRADPPDILVTMAIDAEAADPMRSYLGANCGRFASSDGFKATWNTIRRRRARTEVRAYLCLSEVRAGESGF
jgi:hypothetical protein